MKPQAINTFLANINEARELLNNLQNLVDNHLDFDPENIDWGHAGTAAHLVRLLKEATEAVTN